jgi:putative ABC transport system permease protein
MSSFKLLLAEIRYRKFNFALGLMAVIAAATLFVAGPILIDRYARASDARLAQMEDQTRKLMLAMGFNLLIVHRDTDMADFWAEDFASHDMPQDYVERLAESPKLEHVRHLVATLQRKIKWRERTVLLVGYQRETPQKYFTDKKPMGPEIKPGEAFLGYELWRGFNLKVGDTIEINGHNFRVARAQKERGGKQDIEISLNLADAQKVLEADGRVSQILALGCQCEGERLPTIRSELAQVLPDTKITEHESIAQARAEEREQVAEARQSVQSTLERLAAVVTPLVVLVCAVWVGLLAWLNVRERRTEIGLLRALGKSSSYIAALFLGRAIALGLLGGAAGCLLGALAAQQVGSLVKELGISGAPFAIPRQLALWTIVGAPLVCALASYLPTLRAVTQDPAHVLREA